MLSLLLSALPVAFFVAQAASVTIAPTAHDIPAVTTLVSSADTTGFENITLSFTYDAELLDNSDEFRYGWREVGGSDNQLGFVVGADEGLSGDESGTLTSVALGVGADNLANLEIYFTNTGTALTDETVFVTGISLDGDVIAPAACTTQAEDGLASGPVENTDTNQFFTTIQNAIDDCDTDNGDTIEVAAGTYSEQVIVTKSLDIRGANYNVNPNTSARGAETVLSNGASGRAFSIYSGNTDVSINGFKFDGGSPIHDGNDTSNPQTSDVTFSNNLVVNANAIYAGTDTSWKNLMVAENKFQDVNAEPTASAMQLIDLLTATVEDNSFTNMNYAAITLDSIPTAIISGNTIDTTGEQAIQMAGTIGDTTIENNTITNANTANKVDKGAVRIYGSGVVGTVLIENNTISGGHNGIAIKDGEDITGKDITVTNNDIINIASGVAVYNGGTGELNAQNNWWGSTSGIGSVVGSVDSDPFLCGPFASSPDSSVGGVCIIETDVPQMSDIKMFVERNGTYEESYFVRPGDNVRIEVEATDDSGIEDVEFRIQSLDGQYVAARTFVATPVSGDTYRFEYQVPNDGRYVNTHNPMNTSIHGHRFWARATDEAGNYNNGLSGNFTFDTIVPEMSNIKMYVERGGVYVESDIVLPGENVRIEVQATDLTGAIRDVEFRIQSLDGQYVAARTFVATPVSGDTYRFEYQVPVDGKYVNTHNPMNEDVEGHRFWARVTDEAGNYNHGISDLFTFVIDITKPSVSITSPEDDSSIGATASVFGTASDGETYIDQVLYRVNQISSLGGTFVASVDSGVASGTNNWSFETSGLVTGFYRLGVQAFDLAGNFRYDQHDVEVDTTKPSVVIETPANADVINSPDFTVSGIASDEQTAIDEVLFTITEIDSIGGSFVASVDNGIAVGAESWSFEAAGLEPGFYRLKVQAFDSEGNWRYSYIDVEVVDIEATLEITGPTDGQILAPDQVTQVTAEYIDDDKTEDQFAWAIRSAGQCDSGESTVAGNVNGFSDPYVFSTSTGSFSAVVDASDWEDGDYCLIINPLEQVGEDNLRSTAIFTLETPLYRIGGYKWEDENGDGFLDDAESESGTVESTLSGWTIYLTQGETVLSTTTDSTGYYYFDVPTGTWTVTEETVSGWTQTGLYRNGFPVLGLSIVDSSLDFEPTLDSELVEVGSELEGCTFTVPEDGLEVDFYTCSFGNQQDPVFVPVQNDSSTDSGTSANRSSGGTRIERVVAPTPIVLGATTDAPQFCPFIMEYMQMGAENDTWEVMKLQLFLNVFQSLFGGTDNPVTGNFGAVTDANVKRFQEHFSSEVLDPWYEAGLVDNSNPTGFVYKTTAWKINSLLCPGTSSAPDLTEEIPATAIAD